MNREEAQRTVNTAITFGFRRWWIIPHVGFLILCLVLPLARPDVWQWQTAVIGGLFFATWTGHDVVMLRQLNEATALLESDFEDSSGFIIR